jgi:hypothetical protein
VLFAPRRARGFGAEQRTVDGSKYQSGNGVLRSDFDHRTFALHPAPGPSLFYPIRSNMLAYFFWMELLSESPTAASSGY